MYYYTYRITFLDQKLFGKQYYGRRISKKPPEEDINYRGSGCIPICYFKNNPNRTDYKKDILGIYDNLEDLILAEQILLNKYVGTENCVNLNTNSVGGGCNKGRFTVHKDDDIRFIQQEELESYINKGYIRGTGVDVQPNKGSWGNRPAWNKGKHGIYSDETITKLSNSKKEWYKHNQHPMLNKHQTEESNIKNSETHKRKYASGEIIPYFLGKHHTEESNEKNSQSIKKKYESGELVAPWKGKHLPQYFKDRISNTISGKIKINNGIKNKYILPEELETYISLGWERGFLHPNKQDKSKLCLYWVHKGNINKRVKEEDIQLYIKNGYIRGRYNKNA